MADSDSTGQGVCSNYILPILSLRGENFVKGLLAPLGANRMGMAGLGAQHTSTDVHIMLKGLQSSTKQDIEFFSKNNRSQQVYHCKSLTLICQSLTS